MGERIKNFIAGLENSKISLVNFIWSFLFIAILRSFLEYFSDNDLILGGVAMDLPILIHYIAFYVCLAPALALLLYLALKEDIKKNLKVVLFGFAVVIFVPIVDLIISGGSGYNIAYVFVQDYSDLFLKYLTFFGDFASKSGATPGIRLEIFFVLLATFVYLFFKKRGLVKSLFFTLLIYTTIFIYGTLPFFIEKILVLFGIDYLYSPELMTRFFLFLLFLIGIPFSYFLNKSYFKIILKDIRPLRIIYFESMFFLGVLLAFRLADFNFFLTADNLFVFIFVPISLIFAGLFSIITNNIEDYEIDKISNQDRPLVKKDINKDLYKKIGWFSFVVSLVYAFAAGFLPFFVVVLYIGNYFLYSTPPFRLKRITLVSKLPIAFNSLVLIILGFISVTGGSVADIPKSSVLVFLLLFTLVINFIDIKDYEGDKQAGIKTLPVVLGLQKAKLVCSLFFAIAYLLLCFMVKDLVSLIVFFLLGAFQVYLINKRDYNERHIFIIILLSLIYIISQLLFS